MTNFKNIKQPQQKFSYSKKTKEWRKNNVDFGDKYSFYHNTTVRTSLNNKVTNLNLYNGILNMNDLKLLVNPHSLQASYIPDKIPHHPILVPKVELLVGEEAKRRFDWNVIVTNRDAISDKEEGKKKVLMEKMTQYLQANYSEEEMEGKMKELEHYMKYDWQDIRERMANQILRHYWEEQDFKSIFLNGFKDALIMAEEIYQIDIVHSEPVLTKLNPLKVHTVKSGNSDKVEDSSIIVIEDHWSPGKIVDYFHEELKEDDLEYIMDYEARTATDNYSDDENHPHLLRNALDSHSNEPFLLDSLMDVAEINGHSFNSNFTDEDGNIRVLRVYWKSIKKAQKVKYYNEYGEEEFKYRSEEYILDKDMGEESTNIWINEWWEGTKIGKNIYVQMKPRTIQYNRMNNPSYCHPGIVGQIYNTNQGKAVSLFDRCKNYQYMYDVMWDRLNKAISTNYGKIANIDLAGIPEGWEIEKWLHFAVVNKIAFRDSFKEGTKGASTGKLAGGLGNAQSSSIDMETGNYIQQHIQLLEFIKMEMSEIAGVSQQRQGQISSNETVGGVERSVNQSSHITEYWFHTHEKVKLRVLDTFLETAKIALKGNNKKVQYILDDLGIQMLNIEGDEFAEADYGLLSSSSSKTSELEQTLKQLAQSYLQNGGSFKTIMDIYFSPSLNEMRKKLEISEEEKYAREAKAQEDNTKLAQQAQADQKELEATKIQLEEAKSLREDATKRYIAELKVLEGQDNGDGIADTLEAEKVAIDRQKVVDEKLTKIKELNDKMKMHKDDIEVEKKKIAKMSTNKTTK